VRALATSSAGRIAIAAAGVIALATAIGLFALWPAKHEPPGDAAALARETNQAEIVEAREVPCRNPAASGCRALTIELRDGPDEGDRSTLTVGDAGPSPDLNVGDRIRVVKNDVPPEAGAGVEEYSLSEIERRQPMLWLLAIFALIVVVFGRLRGALALVGLGVSLLIVTEFVLPAILDGSSPLAVALFGSLAVMLVTIALAHGLGPKSIAAILGTTAALLLTALLALLFADIAHLSGLTSEEATLLQAGDPGLSLDGLVIAGMVIAALGVLDDVTVSQASTVMALRRANPQQRLAELYRGALAVGRDHVAATVNTLVLAYVGASLPILLIFGVEGIPFADTINREAISEQVIGMLVGSIGLITAVPITTALAALLATRTSPAALGETEQHVHVH
jgi:uncharacterized membrane protein